MNDSRALGDASPEPGSNTKAAGLTNGGALETTDSGGVPRPTSRRPPTIRILCSLRSGSGDAIQILALQEEQHGECGGRHGSRAGRILRILGDNQQTMKRLMTVGAWCDYGNNDSDTLGICGGGCEEMETFGHVTESCTIDTWVCKTRPSVNDSRLRLCAGEQCLRSENYENGEWHDSEWQNTSDGEDGDYSPVACDGRLYKLSPTSLAGGNLCWHNGLVGVLSQRTTTTSLSAQRRQSDDSPWQQGTAPTCISDMK